MLDNQLIPFSIDLQSAVLTTFLHLESVEKSLVLFQTCAHLTKILKHGYWYYCEKEGTGPRRTVGIPFTFSREKCSPHHLSLCILMCDCAPLPVSPLLERGYEG